MPPARIDSVFEAFARPGSPGCVVSVMRAGEVIFTRGYGLADYAGTYRSAELSSRWTIRANGDRLQVIMPRDTAELRRGGPDAFSDGYLLVVFNRDGAGRVSGLAASTPRTLGLPFTRHVQR